MFLKYLNLAAKEKHKYARVFLFFLLLCFFKMGFLCVALAISGTPVHQVGLELASASQVLRLEACTTFTWLNLCVILLALVIKAIISSQGFSWP